MALLWTYFRKVFIEIQLLFYVLAKDEMWILLFVAQHLKVLFLGLCTQNFNVTYQNLNHPL